MSKKKQQPVPIINNIPINDPILQSYQNPYVKKMEYLIINYLDNVERIKKHDTSTAGNVAIYKQDIVSFLITYNHIRGFHLNLNKRSLADLWKTLRETSSNQVYFLTQITSTFISGLTEEEYDNVIDTFARAYGSFTLNQKKEYHPESNNVIYDTDIDFYKQLPDKDTVKDLIKYNPWVLSLILINQMDTVLN